MLLTKASAVEEATKWAAWLYNRCNQFIQLTECVTVMSLSASLPQKINMNTYHMCEITLNRKLMQKFKSYVNFQVALKQNYKTEVTYN
jgi:hypothetical protein